VAHCGANLEGTFVYTTLDTTDIATGWTEQRAVWGKGEGDALKQLQDIESCLPFPILGFDCDNGSEISQLASRSSLPKPKASGPIHAFSALQKK